MHTLGDMAKLLNRSPVYLTGLQKRFELPAFLPDIRCSLVYSRAAM